MATTIVTKNSSTASAVPTAGQLVQGELAVNVADKKLYTEDNAGSIIVLADGVKLAGIEALADVTDTANVTAAGALMDSELTNITAVKALNQGVATTDSPTFAGATLTTADINAGTIDGTVIGGAAPAAGTFTTGQFNTSLNVDGTVTAEGLTVGDNQWIYAGNGADLKIGHDGTDSIIRSQGVPLVIDANGITFRGYSPYTKHMEIAANGDLSLFEDTGTTAKLFWDASAESLGIGTSTAGTLHGGSYGTTKLHIDGGTDRGQIIVEGDSLASIVMSDNGATADSRVFTTQVNDGLMTFKSTNDSGTSKATIMTMTSSGNVGIGTSSPRAVTNYSILGINGTSGSAIDFEIGEALKTNMTQSVGQFEINVVPALPMVFKTSNTERMRIDSSGNLLVGKTATAFGTAGVESSASSGLWSTRSGFPALALNRLSTDGSIADFYKDSALVGSIGAYSGDLWIGQGNTGLLFNDGGDVLRPAGASGGNRDGIYDLGASDSRFKDLYLSGGVYLGGTGAANLLDDYEEGTWTPTQGNFGTWTSPTFIAKYVKIGQLVTLFVEQAGGTIESTGLQYMAGLPFAPSAENGGGQVFNNTPAALGACLIKDTGSRIWFTTATGSQTSLTFQATYSVA